MLVIVMAKRCPTGKVRLGKICVKKMNIIEAFDIVYDTDGQRIRGLPKKIRFEVEPDFDAEEEIADLVSDETGWAVESVDYRWL